MFKMMRYQIPPELQSIEACWFFSNHPVIDVMPIAVKKTSDVLHEIQALNEGWISWLVSHLFSTQKNIICETFTFALAWFTRCFVFFRCLLDQLRLAKTTRSIQGINGYPKCWVSFRWTFDWISLSVEFLKYHLIMLGLLKLSSCGQSCWAAIGLVYLGVSQNWQMLAEYHSIKNQASKIQRVNISIIVISCIPQYLMMYCVYIVYIYIHKYKYVLSISIYIHKITITYDTFTVA